MKAKKLHYPTSLPRDEVKLVVNERSGEKKEQKEEKKRKRRNKARSGKWMTQ